MMLSEKTRQRTLNLLGLLLAAFYLFPVYWLIVTSLKTETEVFRHPPALVPNSLMLSNYTSIFASGAGSHFVNSLLISCGAMAIVVLLAVPAAYGLARYPVRGMKMLILFFLVTQMLPATVILTPLFIMFSKFGFLNSYLAPVLTNATIGIPFSVLILRTFFLGAPKELDDAAKVDGCNSFTAFLRIMLPIAKPGIMVGAAISFLFAWGDLIYSMTFNRNQNLWPLTTEVYKAIGQYGIQWNLIMAVATMTAAPVVLIFVLLQQQLVRGLASGAVK